MANAQILIVEDENTIAESLQDMLKDRGYGVAGAVSSGEEAIQKALKTRPDLVLMDIKLEGDMDGVEAANQIHKSLDVPVVYLTGYASKDLLERVKITEPYGYVLKPFVARELHVVIEMALYKHKMERDLKKLNETLEQRIAERTAELEIVNEKLKHEVYERRQMEKECMESHKMASIRRLTSSVFHEVLNPLNIISSHVQLLLMDVDKGSTTEKDLNSIREEISRIEDMTKNLLAFSREEEFVVEEVQTNSLLKEVTSLVKPDMKLKNIKLIKRFEEWLPGIMASGDELKQVFMNLITNACDAMPEGGTLTISTQGKKHGGRPLVRIKFTDTGCGIKTENIDKLFEPFFSTKKEVTGVGLGLSESYGIIKSHGGSISVESEAGKGATFIIDLPIERRKKR